MTDSVRHSVDGGNSLDNSMPVNTPDLVGAADLLSALQAGYTWLEVHVAQVNALNVFPVPDGDTGTNMALTVRAALDEARGQEWTSVSELARAVAHGALMGARGNSGVITSQILRGFARGLDGYKEFNAAQAAHALSEASATAYKGVMKPVEGTILTVVREAALAGTQAVAQGADLAGWLTASLQAAQHALEQTPTQLPVLAEAGVVDAGGQGFVFLLEGIKRFMMGETRELVVPAMVITEHHVLEDSTYNFDTQFIIHGQALDVNAIRERIAEFGDSVMVVGDEQAVKVHVHCDDPGLALSYGITQGRVTTVIIENMQEQFEAFNQPPSIKPTETAFGKVGIVAVASGDGLAQVLTSLGVSVVVPGGQTMNPSTQDLLVAIDSLSQDEVIVLPNNPNIILTAEQAKAIASRQVVVVPSRTIPQGIAALLAFNFQADLDENTATMSEACNNVETIEVTRAVRTAQVNGFKVEEGQLIALLNDDLTAVADSMEQVIDEVMAKMDLDKYELVTVYYGKDTTAEQAEAMAADLQNKYPALAVEVLDGGQAHYFYIISLE